MQCARSVAGRQALNLGSLEDDRLVSEDVISVVRESDHLILHSADFTVFRKTALRAEFVNFFQSVWTRKFLEVIVFLVRFGMVRR